MELANVKWSFVQTVASLWGKGAGIRVGGNAVPGPSFLQYGVPRPQRALFSMRTHVPRPERQFYPWERN